MSGVISIRGLAVDTIIGVYDWERDVKQTLLIDIDMEYDTSAAAASDDLTLAIDYAAVAARIRDHLAEHHYLLVETLAHALLELCLKEFAIEHCSISAHKPGAVDGARDVCITVQR